MAVVPILILFAGSMVTWFSRKRHERVLWALNSGTALLVWLICLILVMNVPNVTSLSVWRPSELFTSRLELHLDAVGWLFLYGTATVVVSVVFTEASRPGKATPGTRSLLLSYAAVAMTAMLAGNLLTVAMTWTLMDIWTVVFLLRMQEDTKSISMLMIRWAVDVGGVLLALSAALINGAEGGSSSLTSPLTSSLAAVLLVLAALLRLGLLPPHISITYRSYKQHGLGTLIRLLPPVAALSVLVRMMNIGVPDEAVPWLRLAGVLGVIVGGLRWSLHTDVATARLFLVLGVSGLGVLAASLSVGSGGAPIAAAGIVLLFAGTVVSLTEVFVPTHRLWLGLASILMAGMPGTPGGVIAASLVESALNGSPLGLVIIGILGLILLTSGCLRLIFLPIRPWPSSESLVRVMYGLGLALPGIVSFGLGLRMSGSVTLEAVAGFAIALTIATLAFFWLRRLPQRDVDRWGRLIEWLDPNPLYRLLWGGSRALIQFFRAIGDILEGEGAMLWMSVILLLLIIALGRAF